MKTFYNFRQQIVLICFLAMSLLGLSQTVSLNSLPANVFCAGDNFQLSFTSDNNFNQYNIFTAQLSNESGGFTTPINLAMVATPYSGGFTISLPKNLVQGSLYSIRILASNPAIIGDTSIAFTVNATPAVSFTNAAVFENTQTNVPLTTGLPSGGVYSGNGVENGTVFNPSAAGSGMHVLNYSLTGSNGCTGSVPAIFQVFDAPVIPDLPNVVCLDNGTIQLTTTLPDATFSGPGVTNNVFDPSVAGVGSTTISLNFPSYTISYDGFCNPIPNDNPIDANGILCDDCVQGNIPIGFGFKFFDSVYTEVILSSNGFINFDLSNYNSACCYGEHIPDATYSIDNFIAAFWTDLYPGLPNPGREVNYFTTGTAPNRKFVFNLKNVKHYGNNSVLTTFQIVLHETTNLIEIHTVMAPPVGSYENTQGIENFGGTFGVPVPGRNATPWSTSNDYVKFIPTIQSFSKDFQVQDIINPVVVTKNAVAYLNSNGEVEVTEGMIDDGSSQCAIVSKTIEPDTLDCSQLGVNTVTFTITNSLGQVATGTAQVTVYDTLKPIADVMHPVVSTTDAVYVVDVQDLVSNVSDNCGIDTVILSRDSISCDDFVNDLSQSPNGMLYGIFPWNNSDNLFLFPYNSDSQELVSGGIAQISDVSEQYSIDRNPIDAQMYILKEGPNGRSLYTLDLDDLSLSFISVVNSANGGNTPLKISFDEMGELYVLYDDGTMEKFDLTNFTSTPFAQGLNNYGNCGITYDFDNDRFIYSTGYDPIELYEISASGSVSFIFDFITPYYCSAQAIEYVGDSLLIVGNDCSEMLNLNLYSGAIVSYSQSYNEVGDLVFVPGIKGVKVDIQILDVNGNVTHESAYVQKDEQVIVSSNDTLLYLDENGLATLSPDMVLHATKSCMGEVPTNAQMSISTFDCSHLGMNTVTLNSSVSGVATDYQVSVTVVDTIKPHFINMHDTVVYLSSSNCVVLANSLTTPSYADNCSISLLAGGFGNELGVGIHLLQWTLHDVAGNTSTAYQTVEILDTLKPAPYAPHLSSIIASCKVDHLEIPFSIDNCGNIVEGTTTVSLPIEASTTIVWTYTDANGNSTTQNQNVVIQNAIQIDPLVVSGDSLSSLNNPVGSTFQWINCTTLEHIVGANSAMFEIPVDGNYAVIVSYNGCSDTSGCVILETSSDEPAGLNENDFSEVYKLYPNPSQHQIYFESNAPSIVTIFDAKGSLIQSLKTDEHTTSIDLSYLTNGVYVFEIKQDDQVYIERIIVRK